MSQFFYILTGQKRPKLNGNFGNGTAILKLFIP